MASPDEFKLTFLRGSGFLIHLIGMWDLIANESSQWPSQHGFLIFKETKITAVIERTKDIRRCIVGTYSVEDNRIVITQLSIDTAPERGEPGDVEFELDGDLLTITWLSTTQTRQSPNHVDTFRRRFQPANRPTITEGAVYGSPGPERSG